MSTHATSQKQWNDKTLSTLMVEDGFRLRGLEVTRLDTFVDAAFAFVLTLLVISFDEIPSNYQEMLAAIKRIPGFAASFAVLMMFWRQHRQWSRRYALENRKTIYLSLLLIFVVLVYVYPLRMLFEGLFSQVSNGYLATTYTINSYEEVRGMFIFYSVGFFCMSAVVSLLYRAARTNKASLALNEDELHHTTVEIRRWELASLFAVLSVVLALTMEGEWIPMAGYIYFIYFPVRMVLQRVMQSRYDKAHDH